MTTILNRYFTGLTEVQEARFAQLPALYAEWNAQINVISRADIDNLLERHVLHSLAIARFVAFVPGAKVLDLGTGGGFPGIPLAILYPDVQFTLVDSIGKKIKVVDEVAQACGLTNIKTFHSRAEDLKMPAAFDFVVSRAVAPIDKLFHWSQRLISRKHRHAYPNGLIALKGGNLRDELKALPGRSDDYTELTPVNTYFSEPFFEEKWVVYVQGY